MKAKAASIEQKVKELGGHLSVAQKTQLSKLLTEFNGSVVLFPKFEACDIQNIIKRAETKVEPIVFYLFKAMILASHEDYQKAADLIASSRSHLGSEKPTNRRQWKK